jgi:osmoprotectant transport system ATP-binding protein
VFPLGSTFSPETDSLRAALDSALTSPHGLAVAVTADTQRYAGVVSADTILDKVKDVRASIAESISIREAEAAQEPGDESLGEPAHSYDSDEKAGEEREPDYGAGESTEPVEPVESVYDWEQESAEAYNWDDEDTQAYEPTDESAQPHQPPQDEPARDEPARDDAESMHGVGTGEANADDWQPAVPSSPEVEVHHNGDSPIPAERSESIMDQSPTPPIEDHHRADTHQEGWEAMGKALYGRGSGILQ